MPSKEASKVVEPEAIALTLLTSSIVSISLDDFNEKLTLFLLNPISSITS